jgi:hypothetical protein
MATSISFRDKTGSRRAGVDRHTPIQAAPIPLGEDGIIITEIEIPFAFPITELITHYDGYSAFTATFTVRERLFCAEVGEYSGSFLNDRGVTGIVINDLPETPRLLLPTPEVWIEPGVCTFVPVTPGDQDSFYAPDRHIIWVVEGTRLVPVDTRTGVRIT